MADTTNSPKSDIENQKDDEEKVTKLPPPPEQSDFSLYTDFLMGADEGLAVLTANGKKKGRPSTSLHTRRNLTLAILADILITHLGEHKAQAQTFRNFIDEAYSLRRSYNSLKKQYSTLIEISKAHTKLIAKLQSTVNSLSLRAASQKELNTKLEERLNQLEEKSKLTH